VQDDDADPAPRGLVVRPGLVVPEAELRVRRTHSGGPGGQNVNKVATRIELEFDVASSRVLTPAQKQRILERLAGRASAAGVLRIVSQSERTQSRNEVEARARLVALLVRALAVPKSRRPTRPTRASKEERLQEKKRRSSVKRTRRPSPEE
jgi:ribosome-associated protein